MRLMFSTTVKEHIRRANKVGPKMVPGVFRPDNFVKGKFKTPEAKCRFANHFLAFVESDFKQELFYEWFYRELINCRGHAAHYDRSGFYDVWFSDKARQARFLSHWVNTPVFGDPAWTMSDVETMLTRVLRKKLSLETIQH